MKKYYILGAVLSVGLLVSPVFAQAASLTSAQISSVIQLLQSFGADQSVINNVQTALNTTTTPPQPFCHDFNRDLTVGSYGDDVVALNQAFSLSGINTTGNTSSFDENTAGDAVSFQAKYGIRQTGYVGPITRARLNSLFGCGIPPVQSQLSASPMYGNAPLAVNFTSTQAGNLNFGDGSQNTMNPAPTCATCTPVYKQNHTYNAPGTYTATLTSTVYNNCVATSNMACPMWASRETIIGTVNIAVTSSGTTQGPTISYLSPSSGPVGTKVQIMGSGFVGQTGVCTNSYPSNCTTTGGVNTIYLNGIAVTQVSSNTTSGEVDFTIPSSFGGYCPPAGSGMGVMCSANDRQVLPATYILSVQNSNGTSNTVPFVVTN